LTLLGISDYLLEVLPQLSVHAIRVIEVVHDTIFVGVQELFKLFFVLLVSHRIPVAVGMNEV
jgi:hypothetical protein